MTNGRMQRQAVADSGRIRRLRHEHLAGLVVVLCLAGIAITRGGRLATVEASVPAIANLPVETLTEPQIVPQAMHESADETDQRIDLHERDAESVNAALPITAR